MSGCIAMAGGTVVDSAMVVHSTGSSRSSIAVRVPLASDVVYASFDDILADRGDVQDVSRNDRAKMIDATGDFGEITAQVTPLGTRESLVYFWVDASGTARTGDEVAIGAVERMCEKLKVKCEQVQY